MLSFGRALSRRWASATGSALVKRKRFYKEVGIVSETEAGVPLYKVTLDGRVLKTQGGRPLKITSEPLALAIAQEWSCQNDNLEIHLMRLSGLAMTATDNPTGETKESIKDKILEYLATDTVLFYAPENELLMQEQRKCWDPVIKAANEDLGTQLRPIADLFTFDVVSPEDRRRFESWLMSYNFWALTGMQYAVESSKSVLIPLGLVRHRIRSKDAVRLTLLEQTLQAEQWGQVEWAHGMDELELSSRLSAATLFVYLNSNTMMTKSIKD